MSVPVRFEAFQFCSTFGLRPESWGMMLERAFDGPMAAPRDAFETTLTVPTRHLPTLLARLSRAGLTVLDTGARLTTDEGVDAEATIVIADIATVELDEACALGVSA